VATGVLDTLLEARALVALLQIIETHTEAPDEKKGGGPWDIAHQLRQGVEDHEREEHV
jgi:hypothetical protein